MCTHQLHTCDIIVYKKKNKKNTPPKDSVEMPLFTLKVGPHQVVSLFSKDSQRLQTVK